MDPHLAAILKIAPLPRSSSRPGDEQPGKDLDRLVRAELDGDPALGVEARESLYREWLYLIGDSRGAVLIAGLLEKGDITFLDALEIRSRQILTGLETLPLGIEVTIDRLIAAVRNNFAAAQKDDARATQRGVTAVLTSIDALATGEQVDRVEERLSNMERLLARAPERVLILPLTLDESQRRHLSELQSADPTAAARLGEILDRDGIDGLVALVAAGPEWTLDHGSAIWVAVARILGDRGPLAAAEQAYLRLANAGDVDDRVDAVMAAARFAEADESTNDADRHLAKARDIDDKHPRVKLFEADRAATPEERLALATRGVS